MVVGTEPGSIDIEKGAWVLRCPWHGYEFSTRGGQCPADPRIRIRRYETTIENGKITIDL